MIVEDELKKIKFPKKLEEFIGDYFIALKKRSELGLVGESEFCCFRRFINMYNSGKYKFAYKGMKKLFKFFHLLIYIDEETNKPARLQLYPAQKFMLCGLFGFRRPDWSYLTEEGYLFVGRRNGKSMLLGGDLHYLLNYSKFKQSKIILASCKGENAKICFDEYYKFVENNPKMRALYSNLNNTACWAKSKLTKNKMTLYRTGGQAKKQLDGHTNRVCVIDEWALCDPIIPKTLQDGQEHYKTSKMLTAMSTAQFSIGGKQHLKWNALKEQLYNDTLPDNVFLFLCDPDESDVLSKNYTDIKFWGKANPVLLFEHDGYTIKEHIKKRYTQKAREAVADKQDALQTFLTKQANIWYTSENRGICTWDQLESNGVDFSFEDCIKAGYVEWYLGVDLAKCLDLGSIAWTAYVGVTEDNKLVPYGEEAYEEKCFVHVISWMPEKKLQSHIDLDGFSYSLYVGNELYLCNTAGGESLDTEQIFEYVDGVREQYGLIYVTITADPYNTAGVKAKFADICDCYIEQNQSPKALSQYAESLSNDFKSNKIIYCKHTEDIFKQAVLNALIVKNGNGYYSIEKKTLQSNSNIRIDPVDALLNSYIANMIDYNKKIQDDTSIDDWSKMMKGDKK